MLRNIIMVVVISALTAPAFAQGGGSDEGNKLWEEHTKKYKEAGKPPPNLFDLLFSDKKKKTKPSK